MEINEAFRRIVIGHRWLLVTCALVPLIAVTVLLGVAPVRHIASARIQESSSDVGTDVQADSIVNRVRGIATSPAVVGQAMRRAGIEGRSPLVVGMHHVTVTQIGSSPIVDIAVSDANPRVAQDLTNALARIVVDTLGGQQDERKRALVQEVRSQQQALYSQRKTLLASLANTDSAARIASLSAQLGTVDQELADIASTLRQLAIPDPTDGSAMLISPAQVALPVQRNVVTYLALALLAGLVAGLLAASLIEVFRPKVADVRTLARDLGVPFLGDIAVSKAAGAETQVHQSTESLVALKGSAALCNAQAIVVVGCGELAGAAATMLAVSHSLRDAFAASSVQNGQADSRVSPPPPWEAFASTSEASEPERAQAVSLLGTQSHSVTAPTVVDVHPLTASSVAQGPGGVRHALVVLASTPVPQRDIDQVASLSSATGWPVLGALALTVRHDRRPPSRTGQASHVSGHLSERPGPSQPPRADRAVRWEGRGDQA